MKDSLKLIEDFKRDLLIERLSECTEPQRRKFDRIYPNGVPEEKLVSAIDLCDRTIRKNNKIK